jgi:2-polyprenyl-3-methyl-5-hydroxy-6-metoxy-1,4-benzoquinol methylase
MSLKRDCRICFNKDLHTVLNLGEQPLANDYTTEIIPKQQMYPLCLMWCQNCTHLQLSHVIDKNTLYKHYQYVSGTSTTMYKYFEWIADKITFECNKTKNYDKKILDIACNDGSQLNHFITRGWNTYGVDPAENINCLNNQHTIFKDFFNFEFSVKLNDKFDVILAQNVIAHVDDVHDFIRGCKNIMNDDGVLYIQTSQCNMIKNNEFDTIYHEHHSFFNIQSMRKLVESEGLHLARVERTFIHGTSYLFTIYRNDSKYSLRQQHALELEIESEKYLGLLETYDIYAKNVDMICKNLIERVSELRGDGYTVIGYGAAAKGNTLLNYCKLELNCIIDDADIKWGLYTPGMNIKIESPSHLKQLQKKKLVVIPLAWNFFDEIVEKIERVCPNAFFLRYFPKIEMIYPMTISEKKPVITVIAHFYNEEYLLPFWLRHHKDMFDHGILINYNSTDSSVNVIKSIVPNWVIIDSRNEYFDALECDKEVMDIEMSLKGWKITLNITEFLMTTNLHKFVYKYGKDYNAISIRSLQMIESQKHETCNIINKDESLIIQRTYGAKDYTRKTRTLHQDIHGNYDFGRHNTRVYPFIEVPMSTMVVLWYGYSPMTPELLNRKLQIKDKMSIKDKTNGTMGVEHLRDKDQLLMYWNTSQDAIVDFKMDAELCQYYLLK